MDINLEAIEEAIVSSKYSALAKESAIPLALAWAQKFAEEDSRQSIIAVEATWFLKLEEHTLLLGAIDMVSADEKGFLVNEWKTVKEPTKTWNEDNWIESLMTGVQLPIYALALREGTLVVGGESFKLAAPEHQSPRVHIRAAVKSVPPSFYPAKRRLVISFTDAHLEGLKNALKHKAAAIREAQMNTRLPWQWMGSWCKRFYKDCEFKAKFCRKANYLPSDHHQLSPTDPGWGAVEASGVNLGDPSLVLLTASSYNTSCQCMEAYRLERMIAKESLEMDIGSCFHLGMGALYRQMLPKKSGELVEGS